MDLSETARMGRPPGLQVDLLSVAERVDRRLHGQVPRERIDQLLLEVLERDFRDARVLAFVPIFLQRRACELLQPERMSSTGSSS